MSVFSPLDADAFRHRRLQRLLHHSSHEAIRSTERQTAVARPQGAFYASAAQSLRGNQMEQRMLTATQEIAKHTKKTAELLKDGSGGGSTLTFQ